MPGVEDAPHVGQIPVLLDIVLGDKLPLDGKPDHAHQVGARPPCHSVLLLLNLRSFMMHALGYGPKLDRLLSKEIGQLPLLVKAGGQVGENDSKPSSSGHKLKPSGEADGVDDGTVLEACEVVGEQNL